ncbi:ferrous iron transport protein A [Trichococcus patagoniensis]|uniref:Ferrous iron transport protein A n=1 Tax=Trichococcus patagoniensis TaxID=382641 RepID=A0A2T5IL06_9LACT|nr:FeoA family protein [Trichococcus patagoniensis]PTQ84508.1 ferrous iron transport protein A [Trichococcus patagoniensis]
MELSKLVRSEPAVVTEVSHPDPKMQQRLMDLGFYPGGAVKLVLLSPKQDPKAYEVRGTVIAIRDEDAKYIQVKVEEG